MDNKFLTSDDIERLVEESNKLKPGEMVEGKIVSQIIGNNDGYNYSSEIIIDRPVNNGGKIVPFPGVESVQVHSSKVQNPPKAGFALIRDWIKNQITTVKSKANDFAENMFPGENLDENCFVDQNGNLYWVEEDEYGNQKSYVKFPNGVIGEFTTEERYEIKIEGVFYPVDEQGNILWDQGQEPEPSWPKR